MVSVLREIRGTSELVEIGFESRGLRGKNGEADRADPLCVDVHWIECIARPIDDDQSAGQYDQLRAHVDRLNPPPKTDRLAETRYKRFQSIVDFRLSASSSVHSHPKDLP
mgnify:CR=1 FL=1